MTRLLLALTRILLALLSLSSSVAAAQSVRYRRPYSEGYRLNYGFDHAGGGCTDYACGGACYDGHTGSDFGTPFGTTVLAAASGTVSATNDGCADYGGLGSTCGGRCGNYVQIRHSDGSTSIYCHMRRGSIAVGTGERVSCGQVIGQSASSGNSSGPHLHFGHRSPGASSSDPFAGACSRATSLWTDQAGYRAAPGTGCTDSCTPSGESCNGRDDDCDGRTDEDLSRGCGSDVGECRRGSQVCSGGGWGACRGGVEPRSESCDARDEDCDGRTDEELARRCGTDVGECVSGTEECSAGAWGRCEGAIDPVPERCDAKDNDCDGADDDERICEREEVALSHAGAPTDSDVDGDGRADACALVGTRLSCLRSAAHGASGTLLGPRIALPSTLRMGDLDGDGRADACAREGDRMGCWRSDGYQLGIAWIGPAWPHAGAEQASTMELADVDGDGRLDACGREPEGLSCALAGEHGFVSRVWLAALSDTAGFEDVIHHGSLRFGDLDGDGRADVCVRARDGLECWRSETLPFDTRVVGPRWSDASGHDALAYWSTLRLADVDGDGRDDACMRTREGFRCALAGAHGLGGALWIGPAMRSEDGWDRVEVFSTLRMGDVDGDGRSDACAREPDGARCWLSDGRALSRVVLGPRLSDDAGWGEPARFRSIRLADVSGDGRADLCARGSAGWQCSLANGHGFDETWIVPAWGDAQSEMSADEALAGIRVGGGAGAWRDPSMSGGLSCRITPSGDSAPHGALFSGVLLVLVLALRRYRHM